MDQNHPQTAELNLLWGSLMLEELSRHGVLHLCMAPGSRSTPLTLAAAAQDKLRRHLHFDERGLGFLALGLAKASASPVAIITTSGTAVANLYPAIVEAWLSRVPLIVLAADRPWELIGCGANQATVQTGIFGQYAEQLNLPSPDLHIGPEVLLSAIDEQLANLDRPLHINCGYREPLYPTEHPKFTAFADYLSRLGHWQESQRPYLDIAHSRPEALPSRDAMMRFVHGKGVIVAGTLTEGESPQALVCLSQQLGWPLLTDAQSQLRQHPGAIGHIDQLLLSPAARALLGQADRVLVLGGRLLSKRLITYLADKDWHSYWQVMPAQERLDPGHSSKQLWLGQVGQLAALNWPRSSEANWASELTALNQAAEQDFICHIDGGEFGEAQVMRALAASQTAEQQVFLGNSLPVRLYDMFAPIGNQPCTYTNRGASGIDGLIATACGVARHQGRPTTLVLGDLSALHDLNSLALARQSQSPLIILILNNDGGNIFNLLPVPTEELRANFYRLSHGLEFGYGAAMFGLPYDRVEDLDSFLAAYHSALQYQGASVIEVVVAPDQASSQIKRMAEWIKSR